MIENRESNIKETTHVVAFIDFLGTTKKIESVSSQIALNQIKNIYEMFINGIVNSTALIHEKIYTKVFSDNVIIARETLENYESKATNLNQMIGLAAFFEFLSLLHNWTVRGAITIGTLYKDDIFVWGKGLTKSYNLEKNVAVFPRIIVDKKILEDVSENMNSIELLRVDNDGESYVDFLSTIHEQPNKNTTLEPMFHALAQITSEQQSDASVIAKIAWLKNYYNSWCRENGKIQYQIK